MKTNKGISKTEKSILIQLHLQGFINWGSMKKANRVPTLRSLEERGYIQGIRLTNKGITSAAM